ncbi:protein kinase [Actinosynnema sp. NPDC023587]|uniref:serine/threonine-protein kinase n=1 Tax=Actinosynnema sp. NPDC023587 TaxID=3154695 RepID=UPI00340B0602
MGAVVEERTIAGRYRLTARIGAGGMGVVWRAEDTRLRRIVAVKELLNRSGFDADSAKRVVREGRIAARLQHANVIALYDVVEDDGRPWLVMEYLPSRSLATVLADRGTLPFDEVRRIGQQLAAGLSSAHDAGVIHRDVKPGNVLVTEFGTVKVTDFGTSRVAGEGTLTASGMLVGTPAYLAPEVALGAEPGFPSDVFGVGATLYAALEGTPPFGLDGNPILLLHRAAEGKYAPPENAGPLEPVLTRLLDPDPENRPTMAEAVRMLAEGSAEPATVLAEALPFAAATRIVLPVLDPPAGSASAESSPIERPVVGTPADAPPDPPADPPAKTPTGTPTGTPDDTAAEAATELSVEAVTDAAAETVRDEPAVDLPAAPVPPPVPPPATAAPVEDVPPASPEPVPAATTSEPTKPVEPVEPASGTAAPEEDPDRGRRRMALIAAGLVVVLGVLLVVVFTRFGQLPDQGAGDTTTTTAPVPPADQGQTGGDQTGPEPTGSPQDPPTGATSGQPTGQTTTAPPTTTTVPPQQAGPDQALTDYYALLPGDLTTAYGRLTDRFKAVRAPSLAAYQAFWSRMRSAPLSEVRVEGDRVTARVTYLYRDGTSTSELNVYTLVRVGDGWAIDQQDTIG